ncbi:hypothetical protein GCM10022254_09120 [Actinomadura meridiana]|uniref:Uncharacterized protein n=1 Tax=Actinomadura meridiana TaxID=559626 RepID=A0ABP8BTL8_9ACTN
MSWHTGVLAALAIQVDGPDVETARITGACVMRVDRSGENTPIASTWPDSAPAEEVIAETTALLLRAVRAGLPVVGFGVADALTVLDRECRRHGLSTLGELVPDEVGPVVCARVLDAHVSRRADPAQCPTLAEVCAAREVWLKDPGDLAWCAWAAAGLVAQIVESSRSLAAMSAVELHAAQAGWHREQSLAFAGVLRRRGEAGGAEDQLAVHAQADRAVGAAGSWPVAPFEQQGQLA